ncbi:monovalent cation:proton antiporter family protein [Bacillus sp. ISL-55]|uniref:monovalent cation:proton antiporter family protein n=1 Tax=Bacillus sp. ISL-55 TaxID=2819134 RepID=UPI001BE7EEAC|nr:monovalent cation:proton antiporter family protein [Bacillus sp. ISL-55]MBT2695572.1 monovalent cation:proton antiporter family protein [Bacillus sp. ISL-55]
MEQHASITSLVIVIIVAFLTPILLHRLKLSIIPVVVAEIIMGLIIGKSGFNIVHEDAWLGTLSTLGFLFLMFLSGLEIDFSAFTSGKKNKATPKKEPNTFVVASIIFLGIFIASLGLSYLFVLAGFIENVFLMTLIISTISLGVVVPTLKDAHLMKTNIGQIILLVAVIADLATMILLAVFVSLYDGGDGNTWLLLLLFAAGVALYFVGKIFKNRTFINALSTGTTQIGTRAVFALIILLVAISETVGAENILGAFLAGVLVSLLAPDQDMVHKLDSFGYGFLIPIFFVMVGVDLDIWALFSDKKLLMLIPLLLLALFLSKVIPVYILRKWYDTKTVLAAGFLLTSTLSLVIAAATIGERMEMITPEMSGTLILVAVISSVLTPILFKKLFPQEKAEDKKVKVVFIGANQMTLPVTRDLQSSLYDPVLFHTKQEKADNRIAESVFNIIEMENYEIETIEKHEVYDADIIVITTGDPDLNAKIAVSAKEHGVDRVIARIESPDLADKVQGEGIEVFSVLRSTESLLQVMIESPGVMDILTNKENSLHEIRMLNDHFDGMTLRRFPFTGDVIFVRILRENESIVPHGDTELRLKDRLIVSGSKEYVDELKRELEFCFWC